MENENLEVNNPEENEEPLFRDKIFDNDFENTEPTKYVDLTKKVKMQCTFNEKFKKWVPNIIIV